MKNIFNVNKDFVNTRLDKWFKKNISAVPQSLIEKSLRKGKIKLNGKKVKSSHKIKENDQINFYNLEFKDLNLNNKYKYIPSNDVVKYNEKLIIDNNDNFVVLNKNSGVSVEGGTISK